MLVDIADTIIEVHGHAERGSGYGYCGVRGLNALIATVITAQCAALSTVTRLRTRAGGAKALVRMDSAFYGRPAVGAALRAGAQVSVTVRLDTKVKAAMAAIPQESVDRNRVHRGRLRRGHRAVGVPR